MGIKAVESCSKSKMFTELLSLHYIRTIGITPDNQHHKICALSSEIKGYCGKEKKQFSNAFVVPLGL